MRQRSPNESAISWLTLSLLLATGLLSCARPSAADQKLYEQVSGAKALAYVQALVDFGPRPAGSEALGKSRTYIEQQLASLGWVVTRQTFTDQTPRGTLTFVNLIARFKSESSSEPVFLLCSHYDTKLFDDVRFVGANDGGSSTGLLIELARVLAQKPKLAGKIELVFFDGEEAIQSFTDVDGLYGSRYFARELERTGDAKKFRGGILLDMIGDKSLGVTMPLDSPSDMARDIFATAEAVKCRDRFSYFDHGSVLDDHVPLNSAGISTIDLIDFDYPPWHTADDTMDKISGESLQTVGRVVIYYLTNYQPK